MSPGERACPSSTLDNATNLLGVIGGDGRVHFVCPPLPLDDEFRRRAAASGRPEQRFRFAGPCLEDGCGQWTGTRCGVIDALLAEGGCESEAELKRCAIRRVCRWFAQRGPEACRVCPLVVTDGLGAEPDDERAPVRHR